MTLEERVKTLENELHDLNVEHKELADVVVNIVNGLANLSEATANLILKKEKIEVCNYLFGRLNIMPQCAHDYSDMNFPTKEDCEQCKFNTIKEKHERNTKESQGSDKEKP